MTGAADHRGLPLSTTPEAAAPYSEAVELMFAAWPGAGGRLEAALTQDPEFALAHAARARGLALAGNVQAGREGMAVARTLVARNGTERERSHVEVLALATEAPPHVAIPAVLAHVDQWPRDALILSLPLGAFGLFAFSGMADHDPARVELCARHAAHYAAADDWFLTMYGWALAENGEVARGRAMIEQAFALQRRSANAVHALAHAMFEGGQNDQAADLIAGWLPDYPRAGVLHGHIAWHGALIALEQGDAGRALAIYEADVKPGVSRGMPINVLSDAASLFWRLEAYGHPAPPGGWAAIADYAHDQFPQPGHAFIDMHMALVEAATGDRAGLDRRLAALDAMAVDGRMPAGPVVPATARAARAFADGDYAACAAILGPLTADIARIGGSGAQRQVIHETLLVALMCAGEVEKARALLDARLHRRPSPRDERWRAALAGQAVEP